MSQVLNEIFQLKDDAREVAREDGLQELVTRSAEYLSTKASINIASQLYSPSNKLSRCGLVGRCASQGQLWTYGDQETIERTPDFDPDSILAPSENYRNRAPFVCELPDVTLFEVPGLVSSSRPRVPLTADGKWVAESLGTYDQHIIRAIAGNTMDALKMRASRTVGHQQSVSHDYTVAASLANRGESTYGHWLAEILPRLRAVDHYEEVTGNTPSLILPSNPSEWQLETLSLLGIEDERLIEPSRQVVSVEKFVLPIFKKCGTPCYEYATTNRQWLKASLLDGVERTEDPSTSERLYISRQQYSKRYVENFDDIRDMLREYDFSIVEPENHSIEEQIRMFSNANILLGPWGSGFHNMMFSTGATAVQFIHPEFDNKLKHRIYYHISNEYGHDYALYKGEKSSKAQHVRPKDRAFRVQPERFESIIEKAIKNGSTREAN